MAEIYKDDFEFYIDDLEVKKLTDGFLFKVEPKQHWKDDVWITDDETKQLYNWLTDQLGLGWVSVSERLPEDTKIYLVTIDGYKHAWTASCVFGKWIGERGKPLLGITHYMPLPALPEVNE